MAQAPKTTLPKYNARRGLWVGGDSRTLYTFTDPVTGHKTVTQGTQTADGTHFKHYRIAVGAGASVRVATRAEADAAGYTQGGGGWTTLGRLGPSGAYAGKTNFQWLQRDVATALRRRDCGGARTLVAKAVLAARSPKERGAVVAMQQKVLRCDLAPAGVGRARRRRRAR